MAALRAGPARCARTAAHLVLACLALLAWAGGVARTAEPTVDTTPDIVTDAHVEEALAAAGAHRSELEAALAASGGAEDPRVRCALRFLIANMPHHGYVTTELRDAKGRAVPFDPLAHDTFQQALAALEALEAEHGPLDFARDGFRADIDHVPADFLLAHVRGALAAWDRTPAHRRVGWRTFLEHVLPYRGSEEPLDAWLDPLLRRYAPEVHGAKGERSAAEVWAWLGHEVAARVRFDERYYLHPTDQGFGEMGRSGLGRCEDITNMQTYAARSLGLAVAADYTPWWAHRDNNHAWAVLLDAEGRGHDAGNAHAAKVYRKTFSLQRDALAWRLPPDREPPNRFLASRTYQDVTAQYRTVFPASVTLVAAAAEGEAFAYVAVFNGGTWKAIDWAPVEDGRAGFRDLGGGVVYLPTVFPAAELLGAAPPFLLDVDGSVRVLRGTGAPTTVLLTATRPRQQSVDTHEVTPTSWLEVGTPYVLSRWQDGAWVEVARPTAGEGPVRVQDLPADGLYWLVAPDGRGLERIFTIEDGRQRFW